MLLLPLACATPSPVERVLAEHADELRASPVIEGDLHLACSPPDAEVLLGGVLQGRCEDFASRGLALGDEAQRLEVRKAGYATYSAQLFAGNARTRLKVELLPSN